MTIAISIYERSGSLRINDSIQKILNSDTPPHNAWLKQKILVGQDENGMMIRVAGEEIQRLFSAAVTPVSQTEIDRLVETKWIEKPKKN